MIEAIQSFFNLRWTQQPQFRPLPPHIRRTFVSTPSGDIELLISEPANPNAESPPIFFAHGGFGSGAVWLEWMSYLQPRYGGRTYAYSARNHGASYSVPYFHMVCRTSLNDIASDVVAAINKVKELENGTDPVLVGHSAGGGLSQYILSKSLVKTPGLALVGGVPHYGILDANWNWLKQDPWLLIRGFFHLQHPGSPVSTQRLVHGAFFCPEFPQDKVSEFMRWMSNYESVGWPIDMTGTFWGWLKGKNVWLNTADIVGNILGPQKVGADKVCVLVGSKDIMMDLRMCRRQANEYKEGIEALRQVKKIDAPAEAAKDDGLVVEERIQGVRIEREGGVRLVVVENAGHHTQNDVQYEQAADALKRFVEQL